MNATVSAIGSLVSGPVIDSHFHIFRRAETKQAGILAAPFLQRDVLWADYRRAAAGTGLEASVMVQVNDFTDPLPEAEWVSSVAASEGGPAAIVAFAQLESPSAGDQVSSLRGLPLVRGVRRNTQHEEDPLFCARPEYVAGARLLAEAGYSCDVCVKSHQLEGVVRLAEACPELSIVLNHLGKPDLGGDLSQWRRDLGRLARHQNVSCKVSVVVHTDADPPLTRSLAEPVVAAAVEAFGWERVLFGSNWPVAEAVVEYPRWVDLVHQILAREAASELEKLFSENARRVYRLP